MSRTVAFTGFGQQATRLRTTFDANIAKVLDYGQFIMGPGGQSIRSQAADAVLTCSDHDSIDYALVGRGARLVVDTRNALAEVDAAAVVVRA